LAVAADMLPLHLVADNSADVKRDVNLKEQRGFAKGSS
jgi:hypothetical protein